MSMNMQFYLIAGICVSLDELNLDYGVDLGDAKFDDMICGAPGTELDVRVDWAGFSGVCIGRILLSRYAYSEDSGVEVVVIPDVSDLPGKITSIFGIPCTKEDISIIAFTYYS